MQIKNPNATFKSVSITFDTQAEYDAFREILAYAHDYAHDNAPFNNKAQELLDTFDDEFDLSSFEA